jgi:hypothetical protein
MAIFVFSATLCETQTMLETGIRRKRKFKGGFLALFWVANWSRFPRLDGVAADLRGLAVDSNAQAHVCLMNIIGTRSLALPHESFPWDNRFVDDVEFALSALSAFET